MNHRTSNNDNSKPSGRNGGARGNNKRIHVSNERPIPGDRLSYGKPHSNNTSGRKSVSDEHLCNILKHKINEVDRIKRDIQVQIQNRQNKAKSDDAEVDQVWLKKAKGKLEHLNDQHSRLEDKLQKLQSRQKEKHKSRRSSEDASMAQLFMKIAERELDEETYDMILDEAAKVIARRQHSMEMDTGRSANRDSMSRTYAAYEH